MGPSAIFFPWGPEELIWELWEEEIWGAVECCWEDSMITEEFPCLAARPAFPVEEDEELVISLPNSRALRETFEPAAWEI